MMSVNGQPPVTGGPAAVRLVGVEVRRVLLVDDDPDGLRVTGAMLQRAGFDVTAVISGDQALHQIMHAGPFDALVTDYAMPGLSGLELIRRATARLPALRALLITGYQSSSELDQVPPGIDVLAKPFTRQQIVEHVAALTDHAATPAGKARPHCDV